MGGPISFRLVSQIRQTNQPDFLRNPITQMRPSLVQNTSFAPVNTIEPVGYSAAAASPINLFQPRPSTAPQPVRKSLSEILPPKQNFAFLGTPLVKDLCQDDKTTTSDTPRHSLVDLENELGDQASQVITRATSPEKTRRSRTKSTAKTKVPKRPLKGAANPAKLVPKAQETQGSTIPSIDDILVRSADSQLPTLIRAREELDTQTLFERAVAQTTRRENHAHSNLPSSGITPSLPGPPRTIISEDNISNLSTAINPAENNSVIEPAIDLPSALAPPPPQPFDPDTLTILPLNTIPPNTTTTAIPRTSLPRVQQDALLRSYIVTSLRDPSFLALCTMLDASPDLRAMAQSALQL